jgi:hypothetical protein
MNAAETLKAARVAGISVEIDGDDLVLEAATVPPDAVLDLLSCHKVGVVAVLRPGRDGWSAEDWQVFFDERAGIAEFDAGLSRGQAEACAFAWCTAEWLKRNPMRSPPGRCLGCGCGDQAHDQVLRNGVVESTGHVWLHSRCWPDWYAGKKAEAVAALEAIGIAVPANLPDDFGKNGGA